MSDDHPDLDLKEPTHRRVAHAALCIAGAILAASCGTTLKRSEASADWTTALKQAHSQSVSVLRLARASRANGDFASAINLYRSATSVEGADPEVLVELGDTLVDAGSMDESIEVYQKAEKNDATRLNALLGLQQAHLSLGNLDQALRCADEALELAPEDRRVLIGRGVTLDFLDRHPEAQAAYRAVLVSAPHSIAARNDLALSLALTRKYDEAVELMKPMAQSSTATPRIRQNLALIYGLAGDKTRADALSRVDLDASTAQGNLRFFDFARNAK
jgi:Flp pilus assembly protein TadD